MREHRVPLAVALTALCATALFPGSPAAAQRDDVTRARAAAQDFLRRYVDPDGRVVRRDQGGDTVSEGQSYALLLAQVAGSRGEFGRVWDWTREHLARDDALLATRADADGTVTDHNSASDADVATAWALLRADGPRHAEYRRAGRALAAAVLDHETVHLPGGRLALAAGTWATGAPASLNPSYWILPAFRQLSKLTGDSRWDALAAESRSMLRGLSAPLPPDWARADGAQISPTPAPDGAAPDVRYSLDAQRAIVWASLDDRARGIAAGTWHVLDGRDQTQAQALALDGRIVDGAPHPVPLVASAAAAHAAGNRQAMETLLDRAAALEQRSSTYYGAAWVALGRALLTTHLLDDGAP
jgi:endoglucanase